MSKPMDSKTNVHKCRNGHLTEPYTSPLENGKTKYECRVCRNQAYARWHKRNAGHKLREIERKKRDKADFGGLREKAIQRDNEMCVSCDMTRAKHFRTYGRDITVDHKDLNGRYKPKEIKNNSIDNLQTLCIPCHVSKDAKLRKVLKSNAK